MCILIDRVFGEVFDWFAQDAQEPMEHEKDKITVKSIIFQGNWATVNNLHY